MNGGSRIIDLRLNAAAAAGEGDVVLTNMAVDPPLSEATAPIAADLADVTAIDEVPPAGGLGRALGPAVAILAIAGWLGTMLWHSWPRLELGLAPLDLVQFVAALCVPPALVGILWLLAMRSSTAEAHRFGVTARQMRAEAAALERTIAIVSRQIDANRQALAQQTNDLMKMGDGASERLVAISNGMGHEIATADEQARKLTEAITIAQNNLSTLLSSLPKAHGETAGMAKTLEATALVASDHAAALDAQMAALAERGREANAVAGMAAQKLAAHMARMETTSETAGSRLETVTAEMAGTVDNLLERTAAAVDEARKGIAAQGEAMIAMAEVNQATLHSAGKEAVEALADRIGSIETMIDRIAERLNEQRAASEALVSDVDTGFTAVEAKVATFHSTGIERTQMLAASISALGGSTDAMTETLKIGDDMARKVIATAEDLLVSMDAAAREIDETLPEALARLDARIASSRNVVAGAKPELLALVTAAESTHDAIEAIAQVIQTQRHTLDQLSALLLQTLEDGRDKASAIGGTLDEAISRTHDFAEQAAPRLVEALIRVRDTAATAADRARETLSTVIPDAAKSLELASAQAMQRAVGNAVEKQVNAIAEAADNAVEAAARASDRLTRQMLTIAETTSLVENRIEDARAERDKADSDSFARRASLLIEALNSGAIDIAKSFSTEVSDSAWAAYLKGDRGVFTRRAVRLLDAGEARDVARLYDDEGPFREQVNRYIHDFEAMLRTVLAQRDGSPMGVTLLSSDMGKLYVALAQAIERLRS
ncbi:MULTISPECIES: hypothetical protein [unclassified Sphingomonas]|uniref:hypothetical protein n=1 Tax=unclassified Sphingomonas TaxID=196159 RepID=UPI000BCE15B7|nr:MAG: hypothetical protein B7Y98_13740 [Sphingomonas sp. 32-62-10]